MKHWWAIIGCMHVHVHELEDTESVLRYRETLEIKIINGNRGQSASHMQSQSEDTATPCASCKLAYSEGDQAINCEMCNKWFHRTCIDMSVADYKVLTKICDSVKWFCRDCNPQVGKH